MVTDRQHNWKIVAGVLTLIVLHVGLALRSASHRSTTVDEIFHVTGGYLYNTFGDYRIHPENGMLPQRLHALPGVTMGAKPPMLENNVYWRTSDLQVISYQFFYESGNDHWPILMGARAVNLLLSVGICVLVFFWTQRLAGAAAGFAALGLVAFSPTLLAHGPLATSDVAATLAFTASVAAFWRQLRVGGWPGLLLSAITFGLACVSKFSAVLLIPIFLLLVAAHWIAAPGERRIGWIVTSIVAHATAGWMIIWACYGFRYTAFAPGVPPAEHFVMTWETAIEGARWQGSVIQKFRDFRLLPEAFLFGYTHSYMGSLTRAAFLAGEHSVTGWGSFFPLVFFWKSTPVELAALVIGLAGAGLRWRRLAPWLVKLAPLIILTGVYGLVAINSNLNIGQRHLLPVYPALFICGGIAIAGLWRARWMVTGLLAAQAIVALQIFPFYLAYFNAFAGGPRNAWRLVVDSSLDWGQDLGELAGWLRQNNAGPAAQGVFLSYFGSAEPDYYGIKATRMLFGNGFKLPLRWYEPTAGIYAISATMLQQVYSPVRGPWTAELERDYQELRRFEAQFREFQNDTAARERLISYAPANQWTRAWQRYELLRHARLCAYLRARGPDDAIGHSILIFRLSEAELDAVLRSPLKTWADAITAVAEKRTD